MQPVSPRLKGFTLFSRTSSYILSPPFYSIPRAKGEQRNVSNSPSEDLLPVDGVEVVDLVGFGRNHSVAERSCWWWGTVYRI